MSWSSWRIARACNKACKSDDIGNENATDDTWIDQGMIAIKPSGLKSWEGSITFCVCTIGFVLGLPIGTEVGHQCDIMVMKTCIQLACSKP